MRRMLMTALLGALVAGLALAGGKPDFSGTWELDQAKSEMGQGRMGMPGGKAVTLVIKQTETELTIERKTSERADTGIFKLDGSECVNKAPSGNEIKSHTKWDGATLVTDSSMNMGDVTIESHDLRTVSADGKVMTIDITRKTPRGEMKQKLVYNKQ